MGKEARSRGSNGLFYGWVVVGAIAAIRTVGMAMGSLNFGLFIQPMGTDLGIGRSTFGWAQTARFVVGAAASPIVGKLIDHFGSAVLLAVGAIAVGLAMLGIAHLSHPWQLVMLFAVMGIVVTNGPGALATTVPVAKWFVRKRGRAMGWLFLINSLGGIPVLPFTQQLIDTLGWRDTWIALAVIGVATIVPISLLLVRRQPEDMGLTPDGDHRNDASEYSVPNGGTSVDAMYHSEEISWTLQEAIHSSAFWRLVFVFSIGMLAQSSAHLHVVPHFMDRGLNAQLVAYGRSLEVAVAGFSMFTVGFLVNRIPVRFFGATAFILLSIAIYLAIIGDTPLLLLLAFGTFGMGIGGMLIIQDYLWADYFGRRHLGSIRGIVSPATLVFSATGPPLAGYVWDVSGRYNQIWSVSIFLLLLGAIVLAITPPPRKKPANSENKTIIFD